MKYLGINLTKEMIDMYDEKYKSQINEKTPWIGRINIIKMSILPKPFIASL